MSFWNSVMDSESSSSVHPLTPVSDVTWFDALRFCNRLSELANLEVAYEIENHCVLPKVILKTDSNGFRLLSESEWEHASSSGASISLTVPPRRSLVAWTEQRSQLCSILWLSSIQMSGDSMTAWVTSQSGVKTPLSLIFMLKGKKRHLTIDLRNIKAMLLREDPRRGF